ncbi:hypothetical protein MTO96_034909 [Rhipicephalus appendiculatus]
MSSVGLTWIFAYLSLIQAASQEWGRLFEYLFVISSSLQGLVIFIFHIAYEKTAREFWASFVFDQWRRPRVRHPEDGRSPQDCGFDTTDASFFIDVPKLPGSFRLYKNPPCIVGPATFAVDPALQGIITS